jgi:hypothetical protein
MGEVALASEWAIPTHLPLVTDPSLPVGRLLHLHSIGRGSIVASTTNRWREADRNALPRLGLLIMQECAGVAVGAPFLSVKLLAVSALVCPAPLRTATPVPRHNAGRGNDGDLVLLPLLSGLLVRGDDLLPVGRRLAELLHAVSEVAVGDVGAGARTELAAELSLEEHLADGARLARAAPAPVSTARRPAPAAVLLAWRRLLAPRPGGRVPVAVAPAAGPRVGVPLAVVVLGGPDGGIRARGRSCVGPGFRAGGVRDDVDGVAVVHRCPQRSELWAPDPALPFDLARARRRRKGRT